MSFASAEYVPYLVLVLALFQFVPAKLRIGYLLAASYWFYADVEPVHGLVLLASTAIGYATGLGLAPEASERRRRSLLWTGVIANLGLLAYFKYSAFLLGIAQSAGAPPFEFTPRELPLGISFYAFQNLSYTIDLYRRRIEPCRNPLAFALYVAFFPQLVAGPIERADHLLPQLRATEPLTLANLSLGARRILWGLAKKLIVADRIAQHAQAPFASPGDFGATELWIGAFAMVAVLYCDFSGYTDIARGSARLFGVELVPNFRSPFLSTTPSAFWNRWHMSLCSWIVDYVHSPLVKPRASYAAIWRNNLLVLGLVGLWHGASWTFVLWGLANGALVAVEQSVRLWRVQRRLPLFPSTPRQHVATWIATSACIPFFMVLFFSRDFAGALDVYRGLVPDSLDDLARVAPPFAWIALAVVALLAAHAAGELVDLDRAWRRIGWLGRAAWFVGLTLAIAKLKVAVAASFIYFQF